MIRRAKFGDIPRLIEIMTEAHKQSIYADEEMDLPYTKSLLVNALQRSGNTTENATLFLVAVNDDVVEGFILGLLQRLYHVGKNLSATDMFWYATKRVNPQDPDKLMRFFHRWAEKNPRVVSIDNAVTGLLGDYERPAKMLVRMGSEKYGLIYRKEIKR